MSKQLTVDQLFMSNQLIPVVVLNALELAVPLAEALYEGGTTIMEITLRTPNALKIIKEIRTHVPQMIVGAGTVLTEDQYHLSVTNGANFIVSPGLTTELAKVFREYDVPFLPGAITPTEIMQAVNHGFDYLKFFPAESYNGINALKALASPFSQVKFCPTGGITLETAMTYLKLPNVVGIGCSFLVKEELLLTRQFDRITNMAREANAMLMHSDR